MDTPAIPLNQRFRGYLPVIIDIETAGFNPKRMPYWKLLPLLLNIIA